MTQHTLEFAVHICCPVAVAYAHLAQPANFIGLQPLLSSISPIQEFSVENKHGYKYETVETFRIGPVPVFNNRIRVETILTEPEMQIDSIVHSQPNIRLDVHYQFAALDGETNLIEQMLISVPAWLSNYVIRTAGQVQEQTLANLKRRLETNETA